MRPKVLPTPVRSTTTNSSVSRCPGRPPYPVRPFARRCALQSAREHLDDAAVLPGQSAVRLCPLPEAKASSFCAAMLSRIPFAAAALRDADILSPIAGGIVERKVELGTAVGRDNLRPNCSSGRSQPGVGRTFGRIERPVATEGRPGGQRDARGLPKTAVGKIVFVSPLIDRIREPHVSSRNR